MKLTWLGHACFLAEQDGYTILLDPYTGVEGYPPLTETAVRAAAWEEHARREAAGFHTLAVKSRIFVDGKEAPRLHVHKVLCSHDHHDHNAADQAEVVPFDGPCPFSIRTVETFHDGQGGALRGKNTIHILSAGGCTIAHMGDLGHQLTAEQVKAIGPLDAVLIPVGGYYTIDATGAKAVCEALAPRCVIPMHYRQETRGYAVLAEAEDFLALWPQAEVRRLEGPSLELDEAARGVVVPRFCEEA